MEPITSLNDPIEDADDVEAEEERPNYPRLFRLSGVIVLTIVALWVRLYFLQIVQGPYYRDQADNNRFREIIVPAPRGVIYDRGRTVLARNRPAYTVGFVPADLPDPAVRSAVLARLSQIVNKPLAATAQQDADNAASEFDFVPLVSNVSEDVAFSIEERHRDLPGVQVQLEPIREYVLGGITAPILGYVGRISDTQYQRLKDDDVHRYSPTDVIGQVGIERTFENLLRGQPGQEQMEVDATGRQVQTLGITSPTPGDNLILSIDAGLQKYASQVLTDGISHYRSAAVVAIDPRNGQVLALTQVPSYDDNLFAGGIDDADYKRLLQDPQHPLINAAVSSAYSPGSTFLPITALAGLQTGVITPTTQMDCPGFITVPNRFDPTVGTRLLDGKAIGQQDITSAIADSCGVFFYQVGGGEPNGKWAGVGVDGLAHFAQLFGLGAPTGIDLVEEESGLVPSVRWKRQAFNQEWVSMDTYQMAVGQGYLTATPLQMATAVAAIANGGTVYRPQLVLQTTDGDGNVITPFHPDPVRSLGIKSEYLDLVRQGMIDALSSGHTASGTQFDGASKLAAVDGWSGGGASGSVEFGVPDSSGNLPTHGWYIGFAPAQNPTIAIAVFVEQGTGASDAARVAQQIMAYYHRSGIAAGP